MIKSFGARASGLRLERMQSSPLWQGDGFRNIHPVLPGLRQTGVDRPSLGDFLCGGERRVPVGPLPHVDPRPLWSKPSQSGFRATWLGHSTVLLEFGKLRVLTDPVWGARASPSRLAGPKRFQPAPVSLKALGPIDLVVISHDHYDHLDYPTIRELAKSAVPFVTSLGVGAHLQAWGISPERIHELDWWQSWTMPGTGLEVTATPSQHFSGRSLKDRNATLWSSMVIRDEHHSAFFSGDTGLTTEYQDIVRRFGRFDLVMLEVGAFHPSWGDIHLGPENALKAHALLGGGVFLPVHWGTFSLAMHDWDEPVETLFRRAPETNAPLLLPKLGEAVEPAHAAEPVAWWRNTDVRGRQPTNQQEPSDAAPEIARLPKNMPWPAD